MSAVTETEAKEKWCPFARIGGGAGMDGAAYNRIQHHGDISHGASTCLGSGCMAWRVALRPNPAFVEMGNTWPDSRTPEQKIPYLRNHERGYCGLAGKP